jgi:membrane protein DedA with SNARE-associated domain
VNKLIIIYLAGMTGISKAVPVGIMLQASPLLVAFMTALGALTAATALYLLGGWIRQVIESRMNGKRLRRKRERTNELLTKYGIIGLGILGTILLGIHVTIIMGLLIVQAKRKLLIWTVVGIVIWTSVLTAATASGFELLERVSFF